MIESIIASLIAAAIIWFLTKVLREGGVPAVAALIGSILLGAAVVVGLLFVLPSEAFLIVSFVIVTLFIAGLAAAFFSIGGAIVAIGLMVFVAYLTWFAAPA